MENRLGEKFITYEGYEIEIVQYFNAKNCTIKFNDNTIRYNIQYDKIKKGKVKNFNHKSILKIGYIGNGVYNSKNNYNIYKTWKRMFDRCHNLKIQSKNITYIGCYVDECWYNFQNFAKWYEENWKIYMEIWALDKDILVKGNKVYSPETCCLVPREINNLFPKANSIRGHYPIGVSKNKNKFRVFCCLNNKQVNIGTFKTPELAFQAYKTAKEAYIKEVADEWKNQIAENVYQAMYNYNVEITD